MPRKKINDGEARGGKQADENTQQYVTYFDSCGWHE
jgi:hypothetical protein